MTGFAAAAAQNYKLILLGPGVSSATALLIQINREPWGIIRLGAQSEA
jgi:hypothetical protein